MRYDMTEADYIAYLATRSQDPELQALVDSWPALAPDQLAVISRVMGGRTQPSRATGEAAA